MRVQVFIGAVMAALLLVAVSVSAHGGAEGVVKERMGMMKNLQSVMKVLVPMVKGQTDMDATIIAKQAKIIQDNSGETLLAKFPEGSISGPSEALPAIWQEWDKFKGFAMKLSELGKTLESVAGEASAMTDTFKMIGATCGACHKQFKED